MAPPASAQWLVEAGEGETGGGVVAARTLLDIKPVHAELRLGARGEDEPLDGGVDGDQVEEARYEEAVAEWREEHGDARRGRHIYHTTRTFRSEQLHRERRHLREVSGVLGHPSVEEERALHALKCQG